MENRIQLPFRLLSVLSNALWAAGGPCCIHATNEILHEHLYKGVLVYLSNILIDTETSEDHVKLVRAVLKELQRAQLYAKLSKCEFHKTRLDYLGYCICNEGVEMDPSHVKAILE